MTECSFMVTVVDTTPPALNCPPPMTAECTSPAGTRVDYTAGATDVCDPEPEVTCDPPSGSLFPTGQTTVTCTAIDMSGNRGQCSFIVTVLDRTGPSLTCPPNMTARCTTAGEPAHKPPGWPPGSNPPPNACTAIVEYPLPQASDACQETAPQVTCTPPPGTRLGLGMHVVTCRARDAAGNETTCTFTVDVILGENAFIRGDGNADGSIDIGDGVFILNALFLNATPPPCRKAADSNDSGSVGLEDAVYLFNYQFMGGRRPPDPFLPLCGLDPTPDTLSCDRYRPCE
jgi:hypothetical protein